MLRGTPARRRSAVAQTPSRAKDDRQAAGSSKLFEYNGRSYKAMTDLLRAIMEDVPGHPEDYYQAIFADKFNLSMTQFKRAMLTVKSKPGASKGATPIRPGRRKSSSPESDYPGNSADDDSSRQSSATPTQSAKSSSPPVSKPVGSVPHADLAPREVQVTQKPPEEVNVEEVVAVSEESLSMAVPNVNQEAFDDFSPTKFQIQVVAKESNESNNNPNCSTVQGLNSSILTKKDEPSDEAQQGTSDANKNIQGEKQEEEVVQLVQAPAAVVEVAVQNQEIVEEYDDDVMEIDHDEGVVNPPSGGPLVCLNSSDSVANRAKVEAAMMEVVEAAAETGQEAVSPDTVGQPQPGYHQVTTHAMHQAVEAVTVTEAVTFSAVTPVAVTDDNQYQQETYPVEFHQPESSGEPVFNQQHIAEPHYPTSDYYEAAINAAVIKEQAVTKEQAVDAKLVSQNEVVNHQDDSEPQVRMTIPAKVEFYGPGGRAEVGKMVFSSRGFLAVSQDGHNVVYSLPRTSGEDGCQRCQKHTQISCGGQYY